MIYIYVYMTQQKDADEDPTKEETNTVSLSEYVLSSMIQQTFDNEDRIKARWKKKKNHVYINK